MKQRKFTRVMALLLALSLVAGFMIGIFVVWPMLVPVLLVLGAAAFIYWRYARGKRIK